jgi:hypothetical protein
MGRLPTEPCPGDQGPGHRAPSASRGVALRWSGCDWQRSRWLRSASHDVRRSRRTGWHGYARVAMLFSTALHAYARVGMAPGSGASAPHAWLPPVGSSRWSATAILRDLAVAGEIPIPGLDKAGGPGVVFRALGGAAAEGHGCSRRQHGLPGSAGSVAACRRHDLRSDASKRTVAHQDVFLCRKRSSREHRAQSLHRAFPGPVRKNTWEHGRCRPWNGIWSRWW